MGKLFTHTHTHTHTHVPVTRQYELVPVKEQLPVMPYGREGNRKFDIALAMHLRVMHLYGLKT